MRTNATRRQLRRRAAYAATLAVLALGLAVMGALWRQARHEALRAQASRLVTLGESALLRDPTGTLAYLLQSLELADTDAARLLALRVLQQSPVALLAEPRGDKALNLDFSPDGRWLGVGGYTRSEMIHRSGEHRVLPGQYVSAGLRSIGVRFTPAGEALIGNRRGDVRVWSVPEGREERRSRVDSGLSWLWTEDDAFFTATDVGETTVVRRWPLRTGEPRLVATLESPPWLSGARQTLAFPRGRRLFVRRLDEPNTAVPAFAELPVNVEDVALSRDARRVAASDSAGTIRVWETVPESEPVRVLGGGETRLLRFDTAGRRLSAVGEEEGGATIRLWDLEDLPEVEPLVLRRSGLPTINEVAFDSGGRWLAAGYANDLALWWLGAPRARVIRGHTARVTGLAFTPNSQFLLSVSADGTLRRWPLAPSAGEGSKVLVRARVGSYPSVTIDRQGGRVAVPGSGGRTILVVPLEGGPTTTLEGFSEVTLKGGAFSPDGRLFAAAPHSGPPEEKVVRVWNLETGAVRVSAPLPGASAAASGGTPPPMIGGAGFAGTGVAFVSPDEVLVCSVGDGPALFDLEAGTVERLARWPELQGIAFANESFGLAFRATGLDQGHELIRFGLDGSAPVILRSGRAASPWAALDPGNDRLATGATDGTVYVSDAAGGAPHLLLGHQGVVRSLAFSPDGRWLATGAEDGTIRVWPVPDVSRTPFHELPHRELLSRLRSHTNLRAVPDPSDPSGYRLEPGPFPGWDRAPEW